MLQASYFLIFQNLEEEKDEDPLMVGTSSLNQVTDEEPEEIKQNINTVFMVNSFFLQEKTSSQGKFT